MNLSTPQNFAAAPGVGGGCVESASLKGNFAWLASRTAKRLWKKAVGSILVVVKTRWGAQRLSEAMTTLVTKK